MDKVNEYLSKIYLPAANRAGLGPVGFFASEIASGNPFVVQLASYPSLGAMATTLAKLEADQEYQKAADGFLSSPDLGYIKVESSLLRAFDGAPDIVVPAADPEHRRGRVFELRCYQSDNFVAGQHKVSDFNQSQIAMLKRLGIRAVFFGQTFVGRDMPNLVYMVMFDSMAARDKQWGTFFSDPEWTDKLAQSKAKG